MKKSRISSAGTCASAIPTVISGRGVCEMTRATIIAALLLLTMLPWRVSAATKSPQLNNALLTAPTSATIPTWVFLEDKFVTPEALRAAETALTPHARARRERNLGAGHLVDAYDIPVDADVLEQVRATGANVRHVSRWLNAVSVLSLIHISEPT